MGSARHATSGASNPTGKTSPRAWQRRNILCNAVGHALGQDPSTGLDGGGRPSAGASSDRLIQRRTASAGQCRCRAAWRYCSLRRHWPHFTHHTSSNQEPVPERLAWVVWLSHHPLAATSCRVSPRMARYCSPHPPVARRRSQMAAIPVRPLEPFVTP